MYITNYIHTFFFEYKHISGSSYIIYNYNASISAFVKIVPLDVSLYKG
jgi:hypothetical protein